MDAELRGLVDAVKESREALQAFANDGMPPNYFRHMEAEAALDAALEAAELSVAQGQGFVMVPRVPTPKMIEAGARYGVDGDFDTDLSNGVKDMSRRLAAGAYAAMLAAAPAQPEGVVTEAMVNAAAKAIFFEETGCSLLDDDDPAHPGGYTATYTRYARAALAAALS